MSESPGGGERSHVPPRDSAGLSGLRTHSGYTQDALENTGRVSGRVAGQVVGLS